MTTDKYWERIVNKKLTELKSKFNFSYIPNPGGAVFYKEGWGKCQISDYNEIQDLINTQEWILNNIKLKT